MNEAVCATVMSDLAGMRKGSSAFVLTYAGLVLFLHAQLGTQIGSGFSQSQNTSLRPPTSHIVRILFLSFFYYHYYSLHYAGGFVVERVAKAFEESHEDNNSEACSNHVRGRYMLHSVLLII